MDNRIKYLLGHQMARRMRFKKIRKWEILCVDSPIKLFFYKMQEIWLRKIIHEKKKLKVLAACELMCQPCELLVN